ncbi:hypothetical protein WR25_01383 [Diploscapter pachys]|uniref:Uncharacterized protein n=1 Tax=Diploscapter pachys TaxID=2018661 RepID=A0A2A2LM00_9BILA|nr:hypothetical protein WR25_01383 [Diploscapter pachys]
MNIPKNTLASKGSNQALAKGPGPSDHLAPPNQENPANLTGLRPRHQKKTPPRWLGRLLGGCSACTSASAGSSSHHSPLSPGFGPPQVSQAATSQGKLAKSNSRMDAAGCSNANDVALNDRILFHLEMPIVSNRRLSKNLLTKYKIVDLV